MIFLTMKQPKEMAKLWTTFSVANLLHFHLNKWFQNMFAVGIRFKKWFDVDVLGFQIELCCRYFGLFCLGDFLDYFQKNWANFFQIFCSPWLQFYESVEVMRRRMGPEALRCVGYGHLVPPLLELFYLLSRTMRPNKLVFDTDKHLWLRLTFASKSEA